MSVHRHEPAGSCVGGDDLFVWKRARRTVLRPARAIEGDRDQPTDPFRLVVHRCPQIRTSTVHSFKGYLPLGPWLCLFGLGNGCGQSLPDGHQLSRSLAGTLYPVHPGPDPPTVEEAAEDEDGAGVVERVGHGGRRAYPTRRSSTSTPACLASATACGVPFDHGAIQKIPLGHVATYAFLTSGATFPQASYQGR
jgi:hypothetical protein